MDHSSVNHPAIEPFASGRLRVRDGTEIYWEASGRPDGKPALYLHGGPGSTLGAGGYRRRLDPSRYLIVGIDQRGCGRSRPLVTEAPGSLPGNTTEALLADIEEVRAHLGIERWLVSGVSWGTTLALAYAQDHPERVTELVLAAVTTTSRDEVDWITGTVGFLFPEAWERFAREAEAKPQERLIAAYARRLAGDDAEDRRRAGRSWNAWEAVHVSLDPGAGRPDPRPDNAAEVFATLVTHYWSNDGFLDGQRAIVNRMHRIAHIPAVLIHGRRDVSGPTVTPWRLHRLWPASRLTIIEDEGHGGPSMMAAMRDAYKAFSGEA